MSGLAPWLAAGTVSRRLQDASTNAGDSSGIEWTRGEATSGPNSLPISELDSEVVRRQCVSQIGVAKFDSRRLHHPSLASLVRSGVDAGVRLSGIALRARLSRATPAASTKMREFIRNCARSRPGVPAASNISPRTGVGGRSLQSQWRVRPCVNSSEILVDLDLGSPARRVAQGQVPAACPAFTVCQSSFREAAPSCSILNSRRLQ